MAEPGSPVGRQRYAPDEPDSDSLDPLQAGQVESTPDRRVAGWQRARCGGRPG